MPIVVPSVFGEGSPFDAREGPCGQGQSEGLFDVREQGGDERYDEDDEDEVMWGPLDVVEEMVDEERERLIPSEDLEGLDGTELDFLAEPSGEGDAASDSHEVPPPPSLEDLIAATTVSPSGHVSCSIAPWSARPVLGRITTWPQDREEIKRSVSLRCSLHPRCSVARARRRAPDELLLRWLYSQGCPADATPRGELEAQGKTHVAHWRGLEL